MEIKKENMTIVDSHNNLIETEKGITCGCGNPRLKMVCHIDGRDFFGYQYNCSCGNSITVNHKRSEDDLMMYD